jgi:hypothetical protein
VRVLGPQRATTVRALGEGAEGGAGARRLTDVFLQDAVG